MILNKVGSDAVLVLSGKNTLADTTMTTTLDQTFDYADIKKAAETRLVSVFLRTDDATLKTYFGDNAVAIVTNFADTSEFIVLSAVGLNGIGLGTLGLTKDADTGIWSGTLSLS